MNPSLSALAAQPFLSRTPEPFPPAPCNVNTSGGFVPGLYPVGIWTWATRSKPPDLTVSVNRPGLGGDVSSWADSGDASNSARQITRSNGENSLMVEFLIAQGNVKTW